MDATKLRHIASATEDALTQLDLAAVAIQATGQGVVSPSLQNDLTALLDVRDRLTRRLKALRGVQAQVA